MSYSYVKYMNRFQFFNLDHLLLYVLIKSNIVHGMSSTVLKVY